MNVRIILDILLFVGVFVLPLWLVFLIATICCFTFEGFFEIILLGIIADILFGVPTRFFAAPFMYTLLCIIVFLARVSLKNHLKF